MILLNPAEFRKQALIGLLLVTTTAIAQKTKKVTGKVTAKSKDVIGVVVQNSTLRRTVVTDADGNFSILAELNDTLVFSAVQFKRKILPVSKAIFSTSFVTVRMEEFVNELEEVVVRPYDLTGDLNQDLGGLKLEKDVSAEALGLPNARVRIISQSENKLHDADHGKFVYFYGAFSINVNKILNRLSGRTKMLKKRVLQDKEYNQAKALEERFLDSIFTDRLKIPNNRYYDFIHYCQMDSNFKEVLKKNDELTLWEFLLLKSKAYRKSNDLD